MMLYTLIAKVGKHNIEKVGEIKIMKKVKEVEKIERLKKVEKIMRKIK